MELRHLRYFLVVAEEQNVTRAAARLHVSQPALSRQIHDLEAELGLELFRRTAKSLTLTEPGKIFLIETRAVLLRVDQAVETVRTVAKGDRGQLRVGYAPSLTVELLPKALRAFEHGSPGVRVSLHDFSTEECVQALTARKLDVALIARPSRRSLRGLTFEKIIQYPVCCAVGRAHALAKRRSVSIRQIQRERFITFSRDSYPEYSERMAELLGPHHFAPYALEEYDSVTGLIAAVEAGRGVALVSSSLRCLAGPGLKLLPLRPALLPITLGAAATATLSPLAAKFIDAVRKAAAAVRGG